MDYLIIGQTPKSTYIFLLFFEDVQILILRELQ